MKRFLILIIVIAVLVGGFIAFRYFRAQAQASQASNFQTESAAAGELTATVGATGVVRANQTALLNWLTSGKVEAVNTAIGQQVQANEKLATLEQTSLPQNIILARADLTQAQQSLEELDTQAEIAATQAMQEIARYTENVKDAQYQLDNFTVPTNQANLSATEGLAQMQKNLDAARLAFEPYRNAASGNPQRQDLKEALDQAQSDYNAAVRRLELEYQLKVAQSSLAKAQQDFEKWSQGPDPADQEALQARIDAALATLKQAWIEAPFSGIITQVNAKPGDLAVPSVNAFRIDDLSHLLLDVKVSEVDINNIQEGQDVKLTFDAILGKEYNGKVTEVSKVGSSTQGTVDFLVTVEVTDADENVRPGMTAAVNVIVNEIGESLLVPNRAVRLKDGKRVVYILKDGVPIAVPITLGASSEFYSQVVDGELKVGDLIVLNPPTQFEQNGPPPFVQR
jgi:HlyD family secretion protein